MNLSGSNAPEENVYCEISPKFSTKDHNYNNSNMSSISLQNQVLQYNPHFEQIRDASKSEPPYPSFHKNQNKETESNNNKKNGHNKSNTSVSLQRMNQPPRASNLIRGHSGRSPSNISASSLSLNSNYNNPPPQAVKSPIHHTNHNKITNKHVHSRSHHLSNIKINNNTNNVIPSARQLKLRKTNSNQIYKHGTPTPNKISIDNNLINNIKKINQKSYNRSSTSPTIKTNTTHTLKQKKNSFKRSKTSANDRENDIDTDKGIDNVSSPKTSTVQSKKKTSNKRKNNHVHFKSTNSNKKQQNKPLPSSPSNSSKLTKTQSSPRAAVSPSNTNKTKTTKGNSPTPKRKLGRKNPKLLSRSTTSPTHTMTMSPSPSPSISPMPQPSSPIKTKRNKGIQKRKKARTEREILNNGSASTPTSAKSGHAPSLTFTTNNNMIQKLTKAKRGPIKRSETPQPIYTNSDSNETVRVMRDKEVLQIDEEIPIENFVSALRKGMRSNINYSIIQREYT